jgi:glycosyltransferase involved in cell wall biosynthesis
MIARDLLPALRQQLARCSYEVHLFGAGELLPQLRAQLETPEVRLRGYVPDIDQELLRAHIFVCLNNASPYKVGHTRYLHAWSLGCPVIAHIDAALSMPEIVHGRNALLGASIGDIASQIRNAFCDPELRHHIGNGGYETFKTCFTAEFVVPDIVSRASHYLESMRTGDSALQHPLNFNIPERPR